MKLYLNNKKIVLYNNLNKLKIKNNCDENYLLLEDGTNLLLEDGSYIKL